jgi:branched-chain amino acid transport system permease protein
MAKNTFRYSLYAAVGAAILTLTGIFTSFADLEVIQGRLSFDSVLLVIIIGGAAYFNARLVRERGTAALVLNGAVTGIIVAIALAVLVLIEFNADALLAQFGIDLRFVFQNLGDLSASALTFNQPMPGALLVLLIAGLVLGALAGLLLLLPDRIRGVLLLSLGLTVVVGLLVLQIENIITLPDALALSAAFGLTYAAVRFFANANLPARLALGFAIGAVLGFILALLVNNGGLADGGLLRGTGTFPVILNISPTVVWLPVIFGLAGAVGALITRMARSIHNGAIFFIIGLLVIGVLNSQQAMNDLAATLTLLLIALGLWFVPQLSQESQTKFEALERGQQRVSRNLMAFAGLLVMLVAPVFMGQYITSVLDLVGLYIIMGIGLNIVVGYAGLLDLGYVAFFAIGAYATGILTTPSLLTCGGVDPSTLTPDDVSRVCTGVMTFWQAWPLAILISGLAGVLLGIPVLRLRGDYLAIVTLGFGEIINRLALSNTLKPLLGGAQGISPIPGPVIDLTGISPSLPRIELGNALNIYYLILFGIIIVSMITLRLAGTRLGRAWRAMRADEDVAQAMGINLVQTKLLAFAIGASFAGMGGAIFGSWLQGIFPNSFTLLVSINVLALIIIGGLGSIPGVVVGSLMLLGLPEVLRELQDYRLLAFGLLLVVTMLLKPEGLIPPPVPKLSEVAAENQTRREAQS